MGNFFENITIDNFKVFKDSAKIALPQLERKQLEKIEDYNQMSIKII